MLVVAFKVRFNLTLSLFLLRFSESVSYVIVSMTLASFYAVSVKHVKHVYCWSLTTVVLYDWAKAVSGCSDTQTPFQREAPGL